MNTFECRNCSFVLSTSSDMDEAVFCPRCGKQELFQQVSEEVDEDLENFGRDVQPLLNRISKIVNGDA